MSDLGNLCTGDLHQDERFLINSWNTKYSQNVICICKNSLPVKHSAYYLNVLLPQSYFRKMSYYHRVISEKCPITTVISEKCPITTELFQKKNPITTELFQKNVLLPLFQKNGYDLNVCNNIMIRDILYNADVINHIVKLIGHNPVGKLV